MTYGNQIKQIDKNAFGGLCKLKFLYLHPCFSTLSYDIFFGLKLNELTLFDEIKFKDIDFSVSRGPIEINKNNAVNVFGKSYFFNDYNLSFTITRNFLQNITLNSKFYRCLNRSFEWSNIYPSFTLLIDINGVGKTTLLELIHEALSKNKNDSFISVNFDCKSLMGNSFDSNIKLNISSDKEKNIRNLITDNLLDYINTVTTCS